MLKRAVKATHWPGKVNDPTTLTGGQLGGGEVRRFEGWPVRAVRTFLFPEYSIALGNALGRKCKTPIYCRKSVEIGRQVFIPRVLEHASNLAREHTFLRRQILRDLLFTKKSNLAGLQTGFWDPRD